MTTAVSTGDVDLVDVEIFSRALQNIVHEMGVVMMRTSGNPVIGEMLANVQARISQMRSVTLSAPGRLSTMLDELGQVVDAIEAGDAARAEQLCRAHVEAAAAIALTHAAENAGRKVD